MHFAIQPLHVHAIICYIHLYSVPGYNWIDLDLPDKKSAYT
jgi:hypothetical protein